MKNDILDKVTLRKFAWHMLLGLSVFGSILYVRHKENYIWFYAAAALIGLSYFFLPVALHIFHLVMKQLIRQICTAIRVIVLLFLFYFIFTPVGIAMKVFRKDLLKRRIDKKLDSYWEDEKNDFQKASCERQY